MLQDIYSYSKCCNLLYFFIIFPFLPSLGILAWAHIEMFLEYLIWFSSEISVMVCFLFFQKLGDMFQSNQPDVVSRSFRSAFILL